MDERRPTAQAAKKCALWLIACKDLDWSPESTAQLCDIWWEFHDDEGNLRQSPSVAQKRERLGEAEQLLRECRGVMETEGFDGEVRRIDAWLAVSASEKP